MSQLNFNPLSEPENQIHHSNVKQFGVTEKLRSTVKKTALADVKNILAQRTVHSAKKTHTSAAKSNIAKKNLFEVFSDKENDTCKKEVKKSGDKAQVVQEAQNCLDNAHMKKGDHAEGFVQPVCSFCNKVEDDYADILLKSLTLTKNEIDALALEWERQPAVGLGDMRELLELSEEIPFEMEKIALRGLEVDLSELDLSLLNDIPFIESEEDPVFFEA